MFINTVKISSEGSKYEQKLRLEQSSRRKILKKKVLRITRNPPKHSRIPIAVTAQRLKKLNCLSRPKSEHLLEEHPLEN